MRASVFTQTIQIAFVVRDLEAAMRTYAEGYGIGPWEIYEFNPETMDELSVEGEPAQLSWRLALAKVGDVQWELIEPLDDESPYAQHLAERGEGFHHVGMGVSDYRAALDTALAKGRRVIMGGVYNGVTFAYLSTDEDLGAITEIFDGSPGADQQPDAVYPST
jgi:glyoxalase/bleomycin resistance protein/dioxygenase superfamily protein